MEKSLISALCAVSVWSLTTFVLPVSVRADEGAEILATFTNGNADVMRVIGDRVSAAAAEGNRVAQSIFQEARIAIGQDQEINRLRVNRSPSERLGKDTEKAWLAVVEKKAADGDPFFMDVMGFLCYNGYADVPKDREKAVAWWTKGTEAGGGMAALRLGNCHVNEDVLSQDLKKAAEYYQKAGALGIPMAWYNLGCFHNGSNGWTPRDLNKAVEYWVKSATMGHAWSQFNLAFHYSNGDEGFPVNKAMGIYWMRAAAHSGHSRAQSYVADYLEKEPVQRTLPAVIEDKTTEVVSTFIALDKIKDAVAGSKVAIVCFVDAYEAKVPRPQWLPGSTPSQMLDRYLSEVRKIQRRPAGGDGAGVVNPDDVKVFIVECWADTRSTVREFDKGYPLKVYDGTIPVLYVFHSGKPVKGFTYDSDPGPNGRGLKTLVEGLLTAKP